MEKLKMYSSINEEAGVVMIFSKIHSDLGFPKLVSLSARGFELSDIRLRKTVKELVPELGISYSSIQTLTEEQYNKLLGVM